ncbi:MAG: homoserine kinase [Methylophilaceae bacterium]|nr:MAG: homoserine kinase [Methylophilaceae bacterium]
MSVFTTLTLEEVQAYLQNFSIGEITALKGIAAGITNTNYFVITETSRYVLTIFEASSMRDLPYFVALMTHLAAHDIPCPAPIADNNGVALHLIKDKPALLVSCLKGSDVDSPDELQCAQVGRVLAKMHVAGATFQQISHNQRDAVWRANTAQKVMSQLSADDQSLLKQALVFQENLDLTSLPKGVIHGDLFRDNVLFDGAALGGFIDFYYACHDVLAYDVAIAVNDWCLTDTGEFDEPRLNAFMQAYTEVRPFNELEQQAWQGLLCIAAVRFWLSRLHDLYFPAEGELTHAKDPNYFKNILLKRATPSAL